MFIRGYKSSHKYRRTPSGTPILAFAKKNNQCNLYSHWHSLGHSENRRYNRQESSRIKQGNLEVSATEAVHTYCWISLRYFEYKSILEVSWQQEPLGVEVIPNSVIPNIYTEKLNQNDRFAYFQIIQ